MRGKMIVAAAVLAGLSACAATGGPAESVSAPENQRRGLEPNETNDGGLRQAPPPPEDGESAIPDPS
jgi:hypothetical protein